MPKLLSVIDRKPKKGSVVNVKPNLTVIPRERDGFTTHEINPGMPIGLLLSLTYAKGYTVKNKI